MDYLVFPVIMSYEMNNTTITIIYDGNCPLCSAYVTHIRLRENFCPVMLVNIRQNDKLLEHYRARQVNLDDGMVVRVESVEYFGAEAIHVLACLSSRSGIFNGVNSYVFKHAGVSRLLYHPMRGCRNLLLYMLGRSKINNN